MVVIGVCATVLGGYILYMATNGTLEAATPEPIAIGRTAGIMDAMDWVQPVLGQAIVDDYLLGREASSWSIAAAAEFNRATMIGHRLRSLPHIPFEGIRASAAEAEADHAARNARKRPMAGNASSPAGQEERATTCSKHAAQA